MENVQVDSTGRYREETGHDKTYFGRTTVNFKLRDALRKLSTTPDLAWISLKRRSAEVKAHTFSPEGISRGGFPTEVDFENLESEVAKGTYKIRLKLHRGNFQEARDEILSGELRKGYTVSGASYLYSYLEPNKQTSINLSRSGPRTFVRYLVYNKGLLSSRFDPLLGDFESLLGSLEGPKEFTHSKSTVY